MTYGVDIFLPYFIMSQIKVSDKLPTDIKLFYVPYSPEHENICSIALPKELDLAELAPGKTLVIVAAPGAFTPTCTERHIPAFVQHAEELKKKGADEIIVLTTNDPFVQSAWGKALGNSKGVVKFATDPSGAFSKKLGLAVDGAPFVTYRTGRYALIAKDGVVTYVGVETGKDVTVSSYEAVLEHL
ncbi:hypothetical protein KL905_000653 [Ogataea polymorpha]|uniref:Thioredoxin domain-containing protein n=2 Tax=Ogataea TaxID=461281 RepID=A0A9P8PUA9_9ASCO|nr:hypothetical protein KL937_001485 [Ogataea polymorpha]KAG7891007.1 hypothetical protein KL936_002291 [Ogataea polymorpha]KAG7894153.1 hypothetical protein KL908_002430 [Ogataea polymorpha]KAG7902107.1 hypothetical protein KL935_002067 [Ogataea polymorpha]KAG7910624.1 hypothetical protein KL907_001515 [Ogataea polymorpha]